MTGSLDVGKRLCQGCWVCWVWPKRPGLAAGVADTAQAGAVQERLTTDGQPSTTMAILWDLANTA